MLKHTLKWKEVWPVIRLVLDGTYQLNQEISILREKISKIFENKNLKEEVLDDLVIAIALEHLNNSI